MTDEVFLEAEKQLEEEIGRKPTYEEVMDYITHFLHPGKIPAPDLPCRKLYF